MKENYKETEIDLSLVDLWNIFRNNIAKILITAFVFLAFVSVYVWFIVAPDYISNADVMVQVEQSSSNSSDPNFDLVNAFRLIDTVAELMEKDIILNNAIEKLQNDNYVNLTSEYLRDGLRVSSSSTSYFINISFIDKDTDLSKKAVDAIIDAIIEETEIENAFPVLTDKIRRTSFASEAKYNSPDKLSLSILSFVVGGLLATGFVISKELLSTRFRSKEEVESALNVQVIGVIPKMNIREKKNGKKK